jgi:hypothetical protein
LAEQLKSSCYLSLEFHEILTKGGKYDLAFKNGMETIKLFNAAGIKYQYCDSTGGHT